MSFIFLLLGILTIPFTQIRPVFGLAISDVFILLSFGSILLDFILKHLQIKRMQFFHPLIFPSYLILIGGLLSSFLITNYPVESLKELVEIIFVFLFMPFLIIYLVNSKSRFRMIINTLMMGIFITALIAVIDKTFSLSIGPSIAINSTNYINYGASNRYSGVTMHPNFQGYLIAICIPLLLDCIFVNRKRLFSVIVYVFELLIFLYGLILSGSISSLFAAIIGIFLFFYIRLLVIQKKKMLFILISIVTVLVIISSVISFRDARIFQDANHWILKNPNLERVINNTFQGRIDANNDAFREIREHPMIGVGLDSKSQDKFAPIDNSGVPHGVHNAIIRALLGGGLLVFLGYLIIYFLCIRFSIRGFIRMMQDSEIPYVLGLSISVISFVIIDMAQPSTHIRASWVILFLLMTIYKYKNFEIVKSKNLY